jgi:tyrosine-protein kinase Etk/Wzc
VRQAELSALATNIRALDQQLAGLQSEDVTIRAQAILRSTDRRRMEDIAQTVAVLTAQRAPLLDRSAALDASSGDVAEVDRVLSTYGRQLGQLQGQYSVVSTRLAEAETIQRLSSRNQTERFSLLERAIPPQFPIGSDGKKLAITGAIASVGLALVLAFLLDLMRPVIRTSGQMQRELNLYPIVAIPDVPRRARRKTARS